MNVGGYRLLFVIDHQEVGHRGQTRRTCQPVAVELALWSGVTLTGGDTHELAVASYSQKRLAVHKKAQFYGEKG